MTFIKNNNIKMKIFKEKANVAILCSFNFFDRESILRYLIVNFLLSVKLFLYNIINKKKLSKIKEKKFLLKLMHGGRSYGHKSLLLSLLRGLNNLKIKYTCNKITKHTRYVFLLWADKKDLNIIDKYKKAQDIKVVTFPTACKFDYDYMQWHFPHEDSVDVALYASQWVADICKAKALNKNLHKIKVFPSGVELPDVYNIDKVFNKCVVFFKNVLVDYDLLKILDELNIGYSIIKYGEYSFDVWQNLLKTCDFVIYYQISTETQGLALAEAWSHNLPTLVKKLSQSEQGSSAPYLCEQNGKYFTCLNELKTILLEYKKNPDKFRSSFSPRQYVIENMSDNKSVEILFQILNDIK